MPKRLQNRLYLGYPLRTLKNTIFDVKTSPKWTPKISDFLKKSHKNSRYHGLWSKMPLGSLQEPAKSLQDPPKSLQEPPKSLPRGAQEPSRGTCVRCQVSNMRCAHLLRGCLVCKCQQESQTGVRCQALGVQCQVPGVKCQVPGARCEVSGARCQVSAVRCQV